MRGPTPAQCHRSVDRTAPCLDKIPEHVFSQQRNEFHFALVRDRDLEMLNQPGGRYEGHAAMD
jgi:hypothetical protein